MDSESLNARSSMSYTSEPDNNDNLEKLKRLIATGNALLFTGAGFSLESQNVEGNKIPTAKELAKIISAESAIFFEDKNADEKQINQIKECEDLMVSSDFFLKNIPRRDSLLEILKRTFSINEVTQDQIDICKLNWRKTYTTNYDNTIELANLKAGKTITSLDLTDKPIDYKKAKDICLHINGKLDKASESDLDSKIKLTSSSYLSADQFINSPWYSQFKTDIDHCSAIVFIGYSMYDIDIQKILFDNDEIKEKTFFIAREGTNTFENYKASLFGDVINVGVKGFAELVNDCIANNNYNENIEMVSSMDLYQLNENSHDIRDSEVANFMLFGNVRNEYIDQLTLSKGIERKIIHRSEYENIVSAINSGHNAVITSDLGNGKTVLIKIIMSHMSRLGFDCYLYLNNEFSFTKDLESISKNNKKSIVFIDDYSNKIDATRHVIEKNYDNIQVVISTRHYGYEVTKEQLVSMDLSNFKNYNIDYLLDSEVDEFIDIVDNLGEWGERAGLSKREKLRDLDEEAKTQLSLLLLSVLKSDSIKRKIGEITDSIFSEPRLKNTTFAILMMDVMGLNIDRSLISDIAMNDEIYSQNFIENYGVRNLFRVERGVIKTKSSTLSRYLIANALDSKYVANQLLKIVEHLNKINYETRDKKYSDIITSLLRFSIVEKMLPQKRVEINFYYEKVKQILPRLMKDPHYWVQYAMSVIPFKDYVNAQTYIKTAYSLAERKSNYHTKNIDTQQARLYLLICVTKEGKESFEFFEKGDALMRIIPNDIYKYRQVSRYKDIYEKVFFSFSPKQKVIFEHAVKRIIVDSESKELVDNGFYQTGGTWIEKIREDFLGMIRNIESKRNTK